MKIGLANNLYPPYGRDSGAEIVCQKMAVDFEQAGHDVFIITTKTKDLECERNNNIYYLKSNYNNLNKFSFSKRFIWHIWQLILPPHQRKLKKIIKYEKPDLFISHNLLGLSFALPKILTHNNIEHHHVLHDIQLLHPSGLMYLGEEKKIDNLIAKVYQSLTKRLFKKTKKIISPSKWLLDLHQRKKIFPNSLQEVIPNFNLQRIQAKEKNEIVKFIFAGQLEPHKGIELLLSAWKNCNFQKSTALLTIVGSGSLDKFINSKISNLSNINYLGRVPRESMENILNKHDVVILPSLVYENSPTIIWEAAKYGLRAIASNLGGTIELSEYLELELFEAGNEEDLTKQILHATIK
jgi:glycosyltransferase involved in cell wall biosynthesis